MAVDRDLEEEQHYLEKAYDGLEAMRTDASRMLESVLDLGRGGTFQSRTERDIVVRTSLARLSQLDIGDQALLFGRIDRQPENGHPGDSYHIGRLAVSGQGHEPLVVDWRAPVAEPFYRATGLDPQGLSLRRHLAVKGRSVVGLEDEHFGPPGAAPAVDGTGQLGSANGNSGAGQELVEDGLSLGGPGALLAALGEARTGHMADIVGTIQREQDEIIRSPLPGVLMVQGGPGTGKTAVALHRAAYLLYTHRFPLERQGVLVVGPNPLFLRYIEQVLPSLGETGVTLSTVSGLVPEIRVRGVDPPEVARLKGESRMARVIARAVRTRQRPLKDDAAIPFGATTLRLTAADSAEVVALAKRRPGPHNSRRRFVEQQVVRRLADQYRRVRRGAGLATPDAEGDDHGDDGLDLVELTRQLRRVPAYAEALDRMWPRLAPHELLHDLLGARPLLAAAGRGILSHEEQAMLFRRRSPSLDDVLWTAADAALVDEARVVLGLRRSRPGRARAEARERHDRGRSDGWPLGLDPSPLPPGGAVPEEDPVRSFGHIVIDEVQDLSPLQLRMLARRSLSGSMTAVGDIGQATGPWAPSTWDEVATHLTPTRPPRLVELTVSYRTPAEVVDLARRLLAVAAPGITPPRPVRRSGTAPLVVRAGPARLAEQVAEVAREAVAAMGAGRTAVLVPAGRYEQIRRALADQGLDPVDPRDPGGMGLVAPLVVLPASEANGLEFDAVVVAEPAAIAAGDLVDDGPVEGATTRGLRTLYVAMTRPTRQLALVHERELPPALAEASAVAGT